MIPSRMDRVAVDSAEAYDRYASRYDDLLAENRINAYMRGEMVDQLLQTFEPGSSLLELGCGTGDEALTLASHGCEVLGIDPSGEMIEIARTKAEHHPRGSRAEFLQASASELDRVVGERESQAFDGAFSSCALSYEPNLEAVRKGLVDLIRADGLVVLAVMNRFCASEWFLAMITAHPRLSGRRLGAETPHKVGKVQTPLMCRTPSEVCQAFTPGFELKRSRALPLIVPPHYTYRVLKRWPALVQTLEGLDPFLSRLPVLRSLGDHTVVTLRRSTV